jgi:septation ring formation regulator EzrA
MADGPDARLAVLENIASRQDTAYQRIIDQLSALSTSVTKISSVQDNIAESLKFGKERMDDHDEKIGSIHERLTKIETTMSNASWIAGLVAGFIASVGEFIHWYLTPAKH